MHPLFSLEPLRTLASIIKMEEELEEEYFVKLLIAEYSDVWKPEHRDRLLRDNAEYMRLQELRFLLKNVRVLTSHQLYGAFWKGDNVTYPVAMEPSTGGRSSSGGSGRGSGGKKKPVVDDNDNKGTDAIKRTCVDRKMMSQRLDRLDVLLHDISLYINERIALCPTMQELPRIIQLCRKYRYVDLDCSSLLSFFTISINPSSSPFPT